MGQVPCLLADWPKLTENDVSGSLSLSFMDCSPAHSGKHPEEVSGPPLERGEAAEGVVVVGTAKNRESFGPLLPEVFSSVLLSFLSSLFFFPVLRIEPRAFRMSGKVSTTGH